MSIVKLWLRLRGYKRQAGAVVAILPSVAQWLCSLAGIHEPIWVPQVVQILTATGTLIWGIGWVDRGCVQFTSKTP